MDCSRSVRGSGDALSEVFGDLRNGSPGAEGRFVDFCRSDMVYGGEDRSVDLLSALRWGLNRYGKDLEEGLRFFGSIRRLVSMTPNQ